MVMSFLRNKNRKAKTMIVTTTTTANKDEDTASIDSNGSSRSASSVPKKLRDRCRSLFPKTATTSDPPRNTASVPFTVPSVIPFGASLADAQRQLNENACRAIQQAGYDGVVLPPAMDKPFQKLTIRRVARESGPCWMLLGGAHALQDATVVAEYLQLCDASCGGGVPRSSMEIPSFLNVIVDDDDDDGVKQ